MLLFFTYSPIKSPYNMCTVVFIWVCYILYKKDYHMTIMGVIFLFTFKCSYYHHGLNNQHFRDLGQRFWYKTLAPFSLFSCFSFPLSLLSLLSFLLSTVVCSIIKPHSWLIVYYSSNFEAFGAPPVSRYHSITYQSNGRTKFNEYSFPSSSISVLFTKLWNP